jgi:hypothetical protein
MIILIGNILEPQGDYPETHHHLKLTCPKGQHEDAVEIIPEGRLAAVRIARRCRGAAEVDVERLGALLGTWCA